MYIRENNTTAINGFTGLTSVGGYFEIFTNEKLETLSEFENLTTIDGRFSVEGNTSLQIINGFNKLVKIGDVNAPEEEYFKNHKIEYNTALREINGFNALIEVFGNLEIRINERLETLQGFTNLETVTESILMDRNTALTTMPSFSNLTQLGSGGYDDILLITWSSLTELNSFNNLKKLDGAIDLSNNDQLVAMNGFSELLEVENLTVANNGSLVDCTSICKLLSDGSVNETTNITGNPSTCGSEALIKEVCEADFDADGVYDLLDLDTDNDGILNTVEQNGNEERDTDADGIPDHRDLDSDNDGCFDVLEAGYNDPDDNGVLGSNPVKVDANGQVIASPSYTVPLDADENGTFDFQEVNAAYSTEPGILSICAVAEGYSRFFTPNNDGRNDTWYLVGVENRAYVVTIFDRYGKLLTVLSPNNTEWDGTFNGARLPSADYWFSVQFGDGQVWSGHFSLLR